MAVMKMGVAEIEKFLREEFPQVFAGDEFRLEHADGHSCLLRQRYGESMLRPGGTVSGPTLMALADYAMYAVLLFLLCVLLFPEEMGDYDGFKAYFYSRRQWIFSLMTTLFVADIADTLIKGSSYLHALGPVYYVRTGLSIVLSAAAIKINDQRFHAGFAILATAFEVVLILRYYMTMG